MLGGRTNHWARNSFRMGEYDFKPKTRDGLGVDWPVCPVDNPRGCEVNFEGRYVGYDNQLRNIFIQPTVAFAATRFEFAQRALRRRVGIAESDFHHEAVKLGFR